jgi:cysteine desulfurase/selenocysteine lyase
VKEVISLAHASGIPVLVDGAQTVPHERVDVRDLDADFYCFSGHKMYGPMGIGVLYGKEHLLNELPPYHMGGEMVRDVYTSHTVFNELPFKFEAGTPNVEGVMGLQAAMNYINTVGIENIREYEAGLLSYATQCLSEIEGLRIFGNAPRKASLVSFLVGNIHPFDMGTIIDKMGIAVRTGHHCAQPVTDHFGIPGTVRASFSFYNTVEELDLLVSAVRKAKEMLE